MREGSTRSRRCSSVPADGGLPDAVGARAGVPALLATCAGGMPATQAAVGEGGVVPVESHGQRDVQMARLPDLPPVASVPSALPSWDLRYYLISGTYSETHLSLSCASRIIISAHGPVLRSQRLSDSCSSIRVQASEGISGD